MTNPLDYDHSTDYLPDDCELKISPSKFNKFIDNAWPLFSEVIMDEDPFDYNTSSVLGTVVHYIGAMVGSKTDIDKSAIYSFINDKENNDTYDNKEVLGAFEAMASELVNNYIIPNMRRFLAIEQRFFVLIKKGFYAGGTIDVLEGTKEDCMVVDYKSYNSTTKPKKIPYNYKYQLLVYAYILTKLGYTVSRIRLVYVNRYIDGGISEKSGKPLKSYPCEVTVLTEVITDEDIAIVTGTLDCCVCHSFPLVQQLG